MCVVCMPVCVWAHLCMDMHVHRLVSAYGGWNRHQLSSSIVLHFVYWGKISLGTRNSPIGLHWLASLPRNSLSMPPRSWDYRQLTHLHGFDICSEDRKLWLSDLRVKCFTYWASSLTSSFLFEKCGLFQKDEIYKWKKKEFTVRPWCLGTWFMGEVTVYCREDRKDFLTGITEYNWVTSWAKLQPELSHAGWRLSR